MSKQCYWSSGARRKDWSVNSLRCWRCLVINTPDETPSKAHPSLAGSLLLFALLLSLHQASSPVFSVVGSWCLIVLSAPGLNLLLFLALLIIVLLLFVLLSIYCFLSSSLCHSFLPLSVCHQCNSNPIYFQLFPQCFSFYPLSLLSLCFSLTISWIISMTRKSTSSYH